MIEVVFKHPEDETDTVFDASGFTFSEKDPDGIMNEDACMYVRKSGTDSKILREATEEEIVGFVEEFKGNKAEIESLEYNLIAYDVMEPKE